ncbi:MAG: sulfide/dihydroorotate dehydrogenase-like FAD/NAD-binding protein [Halanaerobium sp.]|nr:sulfide/dihydroorotate dehydrogenase-like FAD/NAD-binding protein [Halanaerobium sp.]
MFKILEKEILAPTMKRIIFDAPEIARKAEPGNFIILRVDEKGERIPLTVADYNREQGTITLIFQEVGYTTRHLGTLAAGDHILDLVGPLGQPMHLEGYQKAVCIGGGSGTALLYPKTKALYEEGAHVITITGARTEELLILENELAEVSHELYLATDDGSKGHHGFVTEVLQEVIADNDDIDLVVAIGPVPMMKAVAGITREHGIKTVVSLNSIMVDGTGMCGGCRVTVGGETKFTCVDGPAFDGHQVDFDELMRRLSYYREHEEEVMEHHHDHHQGGGCGCH